MIGISQRKEPQEKMIFLLFPSNKNKVIKTNSVCEGVEKDFSLDAVLKTPLRC